MILVAIHFVLLWKDVASKPPSSVVLSPSETTVTYIVGIQFDRDSGRDL